MEFGVIGTSIWQQNLPLLERLTLRREDRDQTLLKLKQAIGVEELIYLSTCNRVELMYVAKPGETRDRVLHGLIDFFFSSQRDIDFFPNDFYHLTGKEAITHLFRTASSLESLVIGETQITGQLKQAYQDAVAVDLAGPVLTRLAEEALVVARKVKRETDLGRGSCSMAALAYEALTDSLGRRDNPVIALVGAGPMTAKMAKYIRGSRSAKLLFVNRTIEKAELLARDFGGEAISLEEFLASPPAVDAIVSATAATERVFDENYIKKLPVDSKPIVCVDLAVPRDFSAAFENNPRVTFMDIAALKSRNQDSLRKKFVEAGKADDIVRQAVNNFLSGRIQLSLKPIFHESYREAVELAHKALDDLFEKKVTALGDDDREAVRRLVTKLIGHSSFQPVKLLSDHLVEVRTALPLSESIPDQKKAV